MMEKNAKIYVAGHRGMVGSAIVRELKRQGYENIITRTHKELDLCRQDAVEAFFAEEKPEYVFLAAAKVGGIVANQEALADFMYDNMTLEMNVIHSAWKNGCKKLEFLGSSCIYPRMAPQPMKLEYPKMTLEEADTALQASVRENDVWGISEKGELFLILSQTDRSSLPIILARLENNGFVCHEIDTMENANTGEKL